MIELLPVRSAITERATSGDNKWSCARGRIDDAVPRITLPPGGGIGRVTGSALCLGPPMVHEPDRVSVAAWAVTRERVRDCSNASRMTWFGTWSARRSRRTIASGMIPANR